jgi:hypothetical protein
MKKLFTLLFFVSLLASCAVQQKFAYSPKSVTINNLDLRKYTDKGFLFTPDKYLGEYSTIGIISYVSKAGAKQTFGQINNPYYKINKNNYQTPEFVMGTSWVEEPVYTSDGIDSIYNYCSKLGADAVEELNITYTVKEFVGFPSTTSYGERTTYIMEITITGVAIKRKH